jgi:hypothetical protein
MPPAADKFVVKRKHVSLCVSLSGDPTNQATRGPGGDED